MKKKKLVLLLGIIIAFLTVLTAYLGYRFCTVTKAMIGYYDAVNWDRHKPVFDQYDGVLIFSKNRGILHGGSSYIPKDMEHPGGWFDLEYIGNQITFLERDTEKPLGKAEVNGEEITVFDENGNSAVFKWKGIPQQSGEYSTNRTAASKEINAEKEVWLIRMLSVGALDGVLIGVWFIKRRSMVQRKRKV